MSQQNDLGNLYADLGLHSLASGDRGNHGTGSGIGLFGNNLGALGGLGGEILSQFRYETSMNQSKLFMSGSNLSQLTSQISSIKSIVSTQAGGYNKEKIKLFKSGFLFG